MMLRLRPPLLVLVAAALAIPSLQAAKISVVDTPDYRILWANSSQTEAFFIPQKVLDQSSVAHLPLSQQDASLLAGQVQAAGGFAGLDCASLPHDPKAMRQPRADAMPLEDFLASGTMTLLGRVVAVVPGWSTAQDRAASMAYVEVESLLHSDSNFPKPAEFGAGKLIAVPFVDASIEVEAQQLCSTMDEGLYRPRVGDEVIVNGYPSDVDSRVFHGVSFLVFDDRVWPGDIGLVVERSGQPFQALIDELNGSAVGIGK